MVALAGRALRSVQYGELVGTGRSGCLQAAAIEARIDQDTTLLALEPEGSKVIRGTCW
jgi:hypothetical protein